MCVHIGTSIHIEVYRYILICIITLHVHICIYIYIHTHAYVHLYMCMRLCMHGAVFFGYQLWTCLIPVYLLVCSLVHGFIGVISVFKDSEQKRSTIRTKRASVRERERGKGTQTWGHTWPGVHSQVCYPSICWFVIIGYRLCHHSCLHPSIILFQIDPNDSWHIYLPFLIFLFV